MSQVSGAGVLDVSWFDTNNSTSSYKIQYFTATVTDANGSFTLRYDDGVFTIDSTPEAEYWTDG